MKISVPNEKVAHLIAFVLVHGLAWIYLGLLLATFLIVVLRANYEAAFFLLVLSRLFDADWVWISKIIAWVFDLEPPQMVTQKIASWAFSYSGQITYVVMSDKSVLCSHDGGKSWHKSELKARRIYKKKLLKRVYLSKPYAGSFVKRI